ncbi:MAG: LLM class flavin-dependent oxidoreductase [Acetobacteraceae bacterium]|nr:LLM class flavin-dependent oxidoreductase [Acetobacteraceae bacterium]
MKRISFGLFDWIDRNQAPLHQLYEDRLQLVEAADAAGFFCYHLAEHHLTPLGGAPSPALFLTAAAQRTNRIRLGPLVYLLPLYHPLRLIEEVCMLDQMSRGRLELGIGRGVSPHELRHYGADPAESRAIFNETLEILVAGLTHDRLNFEGKYFRYQDSPMELQAYQRPYPPFWYPTHSPDSVRYAARHGFNFVSLGPPSAIRQLVDLYWQTWRQHQDDAGRLNRHVAEPKVGLLCQMVVADTDEEALRIARTAHVDFNHSILKLWHANDDHSVDALFDWDAALQAEMMICGSPSRVRTQLSQILETTGCNYLICSLAWGGLSQQQSMRSLQLFAQQVMPKLVQQTAVRA